MSAADLPISRRKPVKVFMVVGEESGDQLAAGLMRALKTRLAGRVEFSGVGGAAMAAEGLISLYPLADFAVMGFLAVAKRLPALAARIRDIARAAIAANPDVLVIVDSPDFTHRVARRVRRAAPELPIVDYVSPSVWAWRPGRAREMRRYVDHVLALLPFEPAAHARLGGPPCTYVGHPLAEQIAELRPNQQEAHRRLAHPPVLLVLPGSRRSEIRRLLPVFAAAVDRVARTVGPLELRLPTVPHLQDEVAAATSSWKQPPRVIVDPKEKRSAFRVARAALAASGTVTLELALAGVPMVAAYRVAAVEAAILRRLIRVPSVILANLVLEENIVPEFLQENCTAEFLSDALAPLLKQGPQRQRQLDAFAKLDSIMQIGSAVPSLKAAEVVTSFANAN